MVVVGNQTVENPIGIAADGLRYRGDEGHTVVRQLEGDVSVVDAVACRLVL